MVDEAEAASLAIAAESEAVRTPEMGCNERGGRGGHG